MDRFEDVLKQFSPMINAVLKKAKVYKNHQYYRHVASIALWKAWKNYDSTRGHFAPYAYRCMLTTIYNEMNMENRLKEQFICYEKDKIDIIIQYQHKKNAAHCHDEILEKLFTLLKQDELLLLYELYVYGSSYKDISEKTGISIAALKKRRNRIMKKIRESFHQ